MDKKIKNIIFIIIVILVLAGIGVGGYFIYKHFEKKGTDAPNKKKHKKTPKPKPTTTPSPTGTSPPSPTGTSPPKTCGDLPSGYDVCNQTVEDPIKILTCVNGEYVPYGPTGCNEVDAFTQQYYQKSFSDYCSNSINCNGRPTCQQGNGDVIFECSCGDLPSGNQLIDFCSGQCYVCQNGQYNTTTCTDCNTLSNQVQHYNNGQTFAEFCKCSDGSPKVCTDEGGIVKISCSVCPPDPGSACDNCGKNPNEICMCDVSTNNQWKCVTQEIISGGCPKTKPNIKCSSDPVCVSCPVNNQQNAGYIYYCPGDALPMTCIQANWNLSGPNTVDGEDNIYIDGISNLPVFQTKDNDLCLSGYNNCTNIPADSSYLYPTGGEFPPQWSILKTPQGFLYQGDSGKERGNFQPLSSDTYLINNPCRKDSSFSNACWWTGKEGPSILECQNGGNLLQWCQKLDSNGPSGQVYKCGPGAYTYTDESGKSQEYWKLGTGYCDCGNATYNSKADGKIKQYVGNECQYSDNKTCNGNGIVDSNGNCSCNSGFGGRDCSYTRQNHCSNHGNINPDGSCACDTNWLGNNCQYSNSTTCSNHGTVNINGICSCASGYYTSNCSQQSPIYQYINSVLPSNPNWVYNPNPNSSSIMPYIVNSIQDNGNGNFTLTISVPNQFGNDTTYQVTGSIDPNTGIITLNDPNVGKLVSNTATLQNFSWPLPNYMKINEAVTFNNTNTIFLGLLTTQT